MAAIMRRAALAAYSSFVCRHQTRELMDHAAGTDLERTEVCVHVASPIRNARKPVTRN